MSYYIARIVDRDFESAVNEVIARLKEHGFGVLSDIDVQATLKAKIGADTPRYRILGACNPRLAHEALQIESRLGVLLPCNVIVRETAEHRVEVASVDPVVSLGRTDNETLRPTAERVRQALTAVIESL